VDRAIPFLIRSTFISAQCFRDALRIKVESCLLFVHPRPELVVFQSCRVSIRILHRFVSNLHKSKKTARLNEVHERRKRGSNRRMVQCIHQRREAFEGIPSRRTHMSNLLMFNFYDTNATLCSRNRWNAWMRSACSCCMQPRGAGQLPPYSCGIWSSSITARRPSSTWNKEKENSKVGACKPLENYYTTTETSANPRKYVLEHEAIKVRRRFQIHLCEPSFLVVPFILKPRASAAPLALLFARRWAKASPDWTARQTCNHQMRRKQVCPLRGNEWLTLATTQ